MKYSADSCPPPGYYTITNSLYRCPAYRIGRSIDNTPNSYYGYTMVVNDTARETSKILYIDTLKESLCPGTAYQFSAYFLNIEIPGYCNTFNVHLPAFTFNIETTTGTVLKTGSTGPIPYGYNLDRTPKYSLYGIDFIMPAGIDNLVLKIKDDSSGYTPCGYAFAVDDIQFAAVGPKATIAFDSAFENETVKGVCFQDQKTISMTGNVGPGYTDVAVQWQQSLDSGATWTDIPGATGYQYTNTFSVADTFLFRLRASEKEKIGNPNCSIVSNVIKLQVDGLPNNYTISSNSPVCSGSNLQFNAEGGASYIWTGPNGFYDNVSYAHIYHATLADSGFYYVQVKSFGGCVKTDSIYVKVIGTLADIDLGPNQSICKGKAVQLHAAGGKTYAWSPAAGLSNANIPNPIASPGVSTTYTVTVKDDLGCSNSDSIHITVLNKVAVKAAIEGSKFLCRPADSASFKDAGSGPVTTWHWNFGNGTTSTLQHPPAQHYVINNNTGYTVSLYVTDSTGCADTAYHLLQVVNNCFIAVPGAFTPNGDGLNDYLYPLNAYKATALTFRVYSRYGQLLFETTDWTKKWDGKINGSPVQAGVYVWQLIYTDADNKRLVLHGSTVLIR